MIREKDIMAALDMFDRGYSILESADSIDLMPSEFESILRSRHAFLVEAFENPLAGVSLDGWEKRERRKPKTLPVFRDCPHCKQQYIASRYRATGR